MRPKKRILLIDEDDVRRSVLAYTLHIQGFSVLRAAYAARVSTLIAFDPHLVIAQWPVDVDGLHSLVDAIRERDWQVRLMLVAESLTEAPRTVAADVTLLKSCCSGESIVLRARALCARKKGPAKAIVAVPCAELVAQRIA
jgi:two-component system, OmpR family, response regulator CpxR